MASRFDSLIRSAEEALRHSEPVRDWLRSRRWCGDSIGTRTELAVKDRARLLETGAEAFVVFFLVARDPDRQRPVHLPLSIATSRVDPESVEIAGAPGRAWLGEAERRDGYVRFLVEAFAKRASVRTDSGERLAFRGDGLGTFRGSSVDMGGDSSNVLVNVVCTERQVVLKSYRLLDPGNREPEILLRLHRKRFAHAAPYLGGIELGQGDDRLVLGVATERIQGPDLFSWLCSGWRDALATGGIGPGGFEASTFSLAEALGEATADLHDALVDRRPGPWEAEVFTEEDARAAFKVATGYLGDALRRLGHIARTRVPGVGDLAASARGALFESRASIEEALGGLHRCVGSLKSVTHGDLHLGQVLRRASDGRLAFIDFEGEPERAPGPRSAKLPPLRDVGAMVRSFAYVKHYTWRDATKGDVAAALRLLDPTSLPAQERAIADRLARWEEAASDRFVQRYLARSGHESGIPLDTAREILRGWTMEKALYELDYELKHRPVNLAIPLEGIVSLARSTAR
jgi:maltose alpha-D-glucosyltransferase/alpha-amylase